MHTGQESPKHSDSHPWQPSVQILVSIHSIIQWVSAWREFSNWVASSLRLPWECVTTTGCKKSSPLKNYCANFQEL